MIKADDHWALQAEICSPPAVMMSRSEHDLEFWDKQWPNLLRQASKQNKPKCLALLLQMHDYDYKSPPLPPQFLGWMMTGWEEGEAKFSFMDNGLMQMVVSRLKNSPVSFRGEDGLTILKNGGPDAYFYAPTPDTSLDELPVVVEAWKKWCASPKNQEQALQLIEENFNKNVWQGYVKISAVRDLVAAIPEKKQTAFIQQHAQVIGRSYVAYGADEESLGKMMQLLGLYFKQDWIKYTEPVWEKWFQHTLKRLENNTIPAAVADQFTRIIEILKDAPQPPIGFMWNDQIATHWLMGRSNKLQRALSAYDQSQILSDLEASNIVYWLQDGMKVWDTLNTWGLVKPQDIKQWIHSHRQALGDNWEDLMQHIVVNCATNPDMSSLVMTWSKWQKRTLSLHVVDVPERAKERGMKM